MFGFFTHIVDHRIPLCSRIVTVLVWSAAGPGFKNRFGHLSVGMLQN